VAGEIDAVRNHLLASLEEGDRQEIATRARVVPLAEALASRESGNFAYFPLDGLVSVMTVLDDGSMVEAALVGREGVIGASLIPSQDTPPVYLVHAPGPALALPSRQLTELINDRIDVVRCLARFDEVLFRTAGQISACNRVHRLEGRLIRWLLSAADRVGDTAPLLATHESLSLVLGARRPSVTLAIAGLQQRRALSPRRGRIVIADRPALELLTCECYFVCRNLLQRLFD
jgi:hypothetical protein